MACVAARPADTSHKAQTNSMTTQKNAILCFHLMECYYIDIEKDGTFGNN